MEDSLYTSWTIHPFRSGCKPYIVSLTAPDISLVRNASATCSAASSVGLVIFAERTVKKLIAAPIMNSSHQLRLIMVVMLPPFITALERSEEHTSELQS